MSPKIMEFIKHNLSRFIGVVLIGVVLIGGPIAFYKTSYQKGFSAGYAKAIKDNPTTIVQGGTVNQNVVVKQKPPILNLQLWKIGRVQLGLLGE